jgi:hypothetical protein
VAVLFKAARMRRLNSKWVVGHAKQAGAAPTVERGGAFQYGLSYGDAGWDFKIALAL